MGADAHHSPTDVSRGREHALFALCAIASLIPIWTVKYLPMTDLPHHAAQVAVWARYEDPSLGFATHFTLNWRSPYLLGYALARAAAAFVSVPTAMRLTVSAGIVALPLSMSRLLRITGGDRAWALLGFPLAYGIAFYWGLLNFFVAVPVGVLLLAEGIRNAERPSARNARTLAILALFLLAAHVLVFGFACAIVGLVTVARSPGLRAQMIRLLPLLPAAVCALVWLVPTSKDPQVTEVPAVWDPSLLRPVEALQALGPITADGRGWFAATLVVALMSTASWRRERWSYVPLAVASAVVLLAPRYFFHTGLFNVRFAALLVPAALVALRPSTRALARRPLLRWSAFALIAIGWAGVVHAQLRAFDAEARAFDTVLDRMEPRRSVVSLPLDPTSRHVPGMPYAHFAGWYQVAKGGVLSDSFADLFPMVARHRDRYRRPLRYLEDAPQRFDGRVDGAWDYYLVRADEDPTSWLEQRAHERVRVEHSAGKWYLYRRDGSDAGVGANVAPGVTPRAALPTPARATPR